MAPLARVMAPVALCYTSGMIMRKTITLRLDGEDYEQLVAEARRRGMHPGTLARVYVRAGLGGNGANRVEQQRRIGLDALDRLARITADLPPIDAVQVARESREALEQRSAL